MKPKRGQPETPNEVQGRDQFQTPCYATELILPFIPANCIHIWECCAGEGRMADVLCDHMDGLWRQNSIVDWNVERMKVNMLEYEPRQWDCAITNPPFSIKKKVFRRLIDLNKPFALLIPGDWSQWVITAIRDYDCRIVLPTRRVNYITPSGKSGKESAAQFHSIWLTRWFNVPQVVHVVELTKEMMSNI